MHIIQREKFEFLKYGFEEIEFHPPWTPDGTRVGIDPGTVNMGVCIMAPERTALAYQVKMERDKDPMVRLGRVREVLSRIFFYFDITDFQPTVIIEGASFGDKYRQAELAEQRAATGLWFKDHYQAIVLPFQSPTSIYKKVFGDIKVRAWNEWPQLPRDAASALACALLPLDIRVEKV